MNRNFTNQDKIQKHSIVKEHNRPYMNEISFYISVVAFIVELFGRYVNNVKIQSYAAYIFAFSILVGVIGAILKKYSDTWQFKSMCVVVLLFITTLFSYVNSKSAVDYDAFMKLYCYLYIPITFFIFSNVKKLTHYKKRIVIIAKILIVFFFLSTFMQSSYYNYHDIFGNHQALVLCFGNRNTAAQVLYALFGIMLCSYIREKKQNNKIIILLYIAAIAYMIFRTNSRTIILVALAITCLSALKIGRKIRLIITVAAFITPALFVLLYITKSDVFNNIILFERSLMGGRYEIYVNLFSDLQGLEWVFGDYGTYRFGNAHSLYLAIVATVGIVGLSLFLIWLMQIVRHLYVIQPKERAQTPEYYVFVGILLASASETSWFVSGGSLAFVFLWLYLIALSTEEPVENTGRLSTENIHE